MNRQKIPIKAVVFDLGGVVMSGGYLPFIRHYCMACLTPEGKGKIEQLEHKVNLGKISEKSFYSQIQKVFGLHMTPKEMKRIIVEKMQVNQSLVEFIPRLKPAKVALFTNSLGPMATEVLRLRGIKPHHTFDKVFSSEKIHLAKPDTASYQFVVKKLKLKPEEVLMVDDRKANIDAAKQSGMHGILFTTTEDFKKQLKKYQLT